MNSRRLSPSDGVVLQAGMFQLTPYFLSKFARLSLARLCKIELDKTLLNRAYNSLEWTLNYPPKPHPFVNLRNSQECLN